jgi:DNA-binding response OmpR family regulator
MTRILCIDDDMYLTDLLRFALESEGFDVLIGSTGGEARRLIRAKQPDLVILDISLPDCDGVDVLAWLRSFSQIPVVVHSARREDEDIITSLDQGADVYVLKPVSMHVLVSHVKSALRRAELAMRQPKPSPKPLPTRNAAYYFDGYLFNPGRYEIAGRNARILLTLTESYILHLLFRHEGQPVPTRCILAHLFGDDLNRDVRVIKAHIRRLRRKIAALPYSPQPIRTVAHLGYMVLQTDENGDVLAHSVEDRDLRPLAMVDLIS